MKNSLYTLHTSSLKQSKRKTVKDAIISKSENEINITFCKDDKLDKFEREINLLTGGSFFYSIKKRFSSSFISMLSVLVIMFALISSSIYEDLFKKIIFELPFIWDIKDTISLIFIVVFFFGILIMPSLLDTEGNEFKNILSNWFNKDTRKIKRLDLALNLFDKDSIVNLYNIDLFHKNHWVLRLLLVSLIKRFERINFHIRNDQIEVIKKELENLKIKDIKIVKNTPVTNNFNIDFLLSQKEEKLYLLMQLCSSIIIDKKQEKDLISLELFEYCGRSFFENEKSSNEELVSGFQNFINRSFKDFSLISQDNTSKIYFTSDTTYIKLEDEQKRLAYYLRNHIEECVSYFDNPISLLILYHYVKDIVLDKKRTLLILEKLISSLVKKQQYDLVDKYWFGIAGEMFDSSSFNSFKDNKDSLYRGLSIKSLNELIFLFERNGCFEQSILLNTYLYEINPIKYSINICSLHERMGNFDKAYESLPKQLNKKDNTKPSDIEVRFHQRKAWIIVSQRKSQLKDKGLESLNTLKELLFSHNDDNEAIHLWHYYNIKANYEEWNEDYDEAIINYTKCLNIPTLGSFEYGATFVNMAISYRMNYLKYAEKNIDTIDESINLGNIGISLKQSVGDRDEMPIVLHNQALNILTKMLYSKINEQECLEIITITSQAINILKETNSSKKLAMIYIENILAKALLKKEYIDLEKELHVHMTTLNENEYKQISILYQEYLKLKKKE
ncbi:MAG: hypothetical protein ACJAWW_000674 [Sulfurimonas sp.]|jgi:hypothetical protein